MLGDVMVQELVHSVTNEEVQPGPLPDWLVDHIKRQSTEPLPHLQGGPSRILILYPGEQARRENLERLADEGVVICLLYTSPSPRDRSLSRMPSSA